MPLEPCESTLSPTHSRDRVQVYTGAPTPRILCGYHASVEYPPAYTGGDRRVAQSPDYSPMAGSYQKPDRRRARTTLWPDNAQR